MGTKDFEKSFLDLVFSEGPAPESAEDALLRRAEEALSPELDLELVRYMFDCGLAEQANRAFEKVVEDAWVRVATRLSTSDGRVTVALTANDDAPAEAPVFPAPTDTPALYLALHTDRPGAVLETEVSFKDYARQEMPGTWPESVRTAEPMAPLVYWTCECTQKNVSFRDSTWFLCCSCCGAASKRVLDEIKGQL